MRRARIDSTHAPCGTQRMRHATQRAVRARCARAACLQLVDVPLPRRRAHHKVLTRRSRERVPASSRPEYWGRPDAAGARMQRNVQRAALQRARRAFRAKQQTPREPLRDCTAAALLCGASRALVRAVSCTAAVPTVLQGTDSGPVPYCRALTLAQCRTAGHSGPVPYCRALWPSAVLQGTLAQCRTAGHSLWPRHSPGAALIDIAAECARRATHCRPAAAEKAVPSVVGKGRAVRGWRAFALF